MTTAFTWVGYAAGTLTTIAFLPQVLHVWKTKSADDLHWGMLLMFTVGIALWLTYGIGIRQLPVILPNVVTLALQLRDYFFESKVCRGGKVRDHVAGAAPVNR